MYPRFQFTQNHRISPGWYFVGRRAKPCQRLTRNRETDLFSSRVDSREKCRQLFINAGTRLCTRCWPKWVWATSILDVLPAMCGEARWRVTMTNGRFPPSLKAHQPWPVPSTSTNRINGCAQRVQSSGETRLQWSTGEWWMTYGDRVQMEAFNFHSFLNNYFQVIFSLDIFARKMYLNWIVKYALTADKQ